MEIWIFTGKSHMSRPWHLKVGDFPFFQHINVTWMDLCLCGSHFNFGANKIKFSITSYKLAGNWNCNLGPPYSYRTKLLRLKVFFVTHLKWHSRNANPFKIYFLHCIYISCISFFKYPKYTIMFSNLILLFIHSFTNAPVFDTHLCD